jgi:hypothetical protein
VGLGGEDRDLVEKIAEKISSRFKQVFAVKCIGQSPSPSHLLILKIHHLSGSLACKGIIWKDVPSLLHSVSNIFYSKLGEFVYTEQTYG